MAIQRNGARHHQRNYRLGCDLSPEDRAEVLRRFVHRYTGNHTPEWVIRHRREHGNRTHIYPLQFATDVEWLAHTRFKVTAEGRLHKGSCYCESFPTWPSNAELRRNEGVAA
jgi:hypothetical protein